MQLVEAFKIGGEMYGLAFQKASFWARFFSLQLLKLRDLGVLKEIFEKYQFPVAFCEDQEDNISLGIEKLVALAVIILSGAILALIIFPFELLLSKKK